MLAKGNPQWPQVIDDNTLSLMVTTGHADSGRWSPDIRLISDHIALQAFYPMENVETINPGEILTARCTFNSTGHSTMTRIGHAGGDEMCNLYLMYYTLSAEDDFVLCVDEQNAALTAQLPAGNDTPLPPNPELEHVAAGHDETEQNYNNGQHGNMEIPVKKQDNSVKKRPGVNDGDYTDASPDTTNNNDNLGDGLANDMSLDNGSGMMPREARYNPGFVDTTYLNQHLAVKTCLT